jgi:hypothetical protein
MPNETPNSVAENAKLSIVPAKTPQLPEELVDLIVEHVLRTLYRRRPDLRKAAKPQTRAVTEKHFHFDQANFTNVLAALCTESARAQTLLAELRQARAEYLATAGATFPKG